MGYLDQDGYLFLSDRKRDMIISGGVNIYPAEIEAELLRISGVSDCAVFGIPDAEFGEQVIALIEPQAGVEISPSQVTDQLRQSLASFKIPRRIELRDKLPREESGKIFKRKLREPYWAEHKRNI
jgi:long-chain acyl-CoA synthetase